MSNLGPEYVSNLEKCLILSTFLQKRGLHSNKWFWRPIFDWNVCFYWLFGILQLFMCQKWHCYSNLSISSLEDFHKPPSKSCKGMKSKIPKNLPGTCFICKGFAINESQLLNGILFKKKCVWNRLLYFVIHRKQEKCLILSTFLCIFLKIPIYFYKREYNIEICIHVMTL